MRTTRQLAALAALIATAAPIHLGAAETTSTEIQCDPRPGYHLCEARADRKDGEELQHEWAVTGDLTINLASGPMASIRCQEGEKGAVWLQTRTPEGQTKSTCVEINCGAETTPPCEG